MRRVVIMGAAGRDFHNFNTVYRDDPATRVVAFTASQIPGIDDRSYPAGLAGPLYPDGIPIRGEDELADLISHHDVDEVVFAYSDVAHVEVMHKACVALSAGADFRLLGPDATMLDARKPVIAVCAVRTGCGKSQTSRHIGRLLGAAGLRVALVRHPMPYGDLEAMAVQRFETLADIDASAPTIEEREEYEEPVRAGIVVYAGVDYEAVLRRAEAEADVIIWDGGNNDFPFYRPDLWITVLDPLRPGQELASYPGEVNLRRADVLVVNKIDVATLADVSMVVANAVAVNPAATLVRASSPVTLDDGPSLIGKRVLVIEDGPSVTHGGLPFGAGTVAARQGGATELLDPRPYAVGSLVATFAQYPHLGPVLPAMGYSKGQLADLAATIARARPDVVVTGTPVDLQHVLRIGAAVRHARYELVELGRPTLADVLAPRLQAWQRAAG